ncbi:hypothetical protein WT88_29440 [Burkholderia stagnalis]|nr:hypothetical protein WT35_04380 [Burkholderia stagnalis]KWN32831.1 hypothetical protein WT86_18505 [Burkholderia stagnalis]KWN44658.1 hypothetical protein WT88_29440 [Burkholderia stagnalis]KWN54391.1 hypothetical protein WT87_03535 [Burkholderia stagnalis]KWO68798.1 hypothetical protein WT99_20905 [Burkholderia stagnalis]
MRLGRHVEQQRENCWERRGAFRLTLDETAIPIGVGDRLTCVRVAEVAFADSDSNVVLCCRLCSAEQFFEIA